MEITGDTGTTKCLRCHRVLRCESSRRAGYGRWCRAKIRAAMLAEIVKDFTEAQIEAAREIIADGAAVALGHPGAYRMASSDGSAIYTTTAKGCNCPNWLRRLSPKPCKHNLVARIFDASKGA